MPEFSRLWTRACRAVVVCGLVVLAACSTTQWDTSAENAETVSTVKEYSRDEAGVRESIVDHLSTVGDNLNEWAPPRAEAECAADKAITRFGVDRLLALGYEPSVGSLGLPYTEDESTQMLNILANCIDFETGFLSMFSSYQKLDIESSKCLAASLKRLGLIRDLAAGLLRGSEPDPFGNENRLADGVTSSMKECLDIEDLLPVIDTPDFPQDLDETTTTAAPGGTTTTTSGFGSTSTTAP